MESTPDHFQCNCIKQIQPKGASNEFLSTRLPSVVNHEILFFFSNCYSPGGVRERERKGDRVAAFNRWWVPVIIVPRHYQLSGGAGNRRRWYNDREEASKQDWSTKEKIQLREAEAQHTQQCSLLVIWNCRLWSLHHWIRLDTIHLSLSLWRYRQQKPLLLLLLSERCLAVVFYVPLYIALVYVCDLRLSGRVLSDGSEEKGGTITRRERERVPLFATSNVTDGL